MNIWTFLRHPNLRQSAKRIQYNYYLKNWIERRKNRELLKKAREDPKDDISNKQPLVSVLIPTYNRGRILTERTVPSVLKQTYKKFELIIVGDHCTDNTGELLETFNDERIKFYNLSKRGQYPTNPRDRWMVAGTVPANKAIELSTGEWLAPLDDDDEFSGDHIEILLNHALEHDCEMVYGKVKWEIEPDKWIELGSYPLECDKISHLSVLYHSKLKFLRYDIDAWKYKEPADWNRWRQMKEAGVRIGFLNKVVGKHYLEGTQRGV